MFPHLDWTRLRTRQSDLKMKNSCAGPQLYPPRAQHGFCNSNNGSITDMRLCPISSNYGAVLDLRNDREGYDDQSLVHIKPRTGSASVLPRAYAVSREHRRPANLDGKCPIA